MSSSKASRGGRKEEINITVPLLKNWKFGAYGEAMQQQAIQVQPLYQQVIEPNEANQQQQVRLISPNNNPMPQNALSPGASPPATSSGYRSASISQPHSPPPVGPRPVASLSQLPLECCPDQTSDPNWQSSKNSVRERNGAMFNNELMSDVTFLVGPKGSQKSIPAHKYVLSTGSSVFYAMFYGGFTETAGQVAIPDVEPSAFLTLLRYLYTDDICLETDNVLSTLYAAKKYLLPNLASACVEFLETSLTARNACILLSQGRLYDEADLMERCWEVIDAQAELALASEGFVDIDYNTLESILKRETLNAKEIRLFYAAVQWAACECQRLEIESTPGNQRKVLGKAFQLIRIPSMTLEDFANGPAQSGLLTLKETTDIFLNYTALNKPDLMFISRTREGMKILICHRFQSSAYRNNQWRYRGRVDSIEFAVDKRIFIIGFGLYGSSNGAADYNVKMELKRAEKHTSGKILAENHTKFFSDGSSNTFHIFFKHPIQVEPNTFYTASVILDGAELSYFGEDGHSDVMVNGTFAFQFQSSSDSTNGTTLQGGQIPEILFYAPSSDESPICIA
ncbi:BTB/POZ domain-containing protein 3 [Halotydeus destructor]|nr:BTB/POZ domain-containing protein 3 [Halotydeus destructor]